MAAQSRVAGQDDPSVNGQNVDADMPPALGAGRERRVSARAYNYWVSLLAGREFPSVADLNANDIANFRDQSILLDFTIDPEQPILRYIGKGLRDESGLSTNELRPQDVPGKSLLSRLTAHYMEIIANRAPIGFEAEFHNVQGRLTFYRGILLPLSDDDANINFIYGVISWKEEAAPAQSADAVAALAAIPAKPSPVKSMAITSVDDIFELSRQVEQVQLEPALKEEALEVSEKISETNEDDILDLDTLQDAPLELTHSEEPLELNVVEADAPLDLAMQLDIVDSKTSDDILELDAPGVALVADEESIARLADQLAAAREAAEGIKSADSRSRAALYDALGESLAFHAQATADPAAFAVLLEDAGLVMQDRAPFTPTVKMIFGADHDKTRLTEYAAALSFAHREGILPESFSGYLDTYPGGLKGIVQAERTQRAAAQGNRRVDKATEARLALNTAPVQATLSTSGVATDPDGFVLLVGRANAYGGIDIVAAAPPHAPTLDMVLRQLKRKR